MEFDRQEMRLMFRDRKDEYNEVFYAQRENTIEDICNKCCSEGTQLERSIRSKGDRN